MKLTTVLLAALCGFFTPVNADERTYLVFNFSEHTRIVLDPQALCVSTVPEYKWHRAAIQNTDGRFHKGCYIQGEGATKNMYIIVWTKTDRSEIPMAAFHEEKAVSVKAEEPKADL
jgi:hypothetical protein